jgi:hypothetical protein
LINRRGPERNLDNDLSSTSGVGKKPKFFRGNFDRFTNKSFL